MTTKTIKTRVRTHVPAHMETQTKEVPVIDSTWFDADGNPQSIDEVGARLWELGIREDCEVGVVLELVPEGVEVRKPTGETIYTRASDEWFRRTLNITDSRIILVGGEGVLNLEDPKKIFMATLSAIFGGRWEDIDEELSYMRSPQ